MRKKIIWTKPHIHDDEEDYDYDESDESMPTILLKKHTIIDEKDFNIFFMHTNFYITQKIKKLLNRAEGVESLDIISCYRARVGIGYAFEESYVKKHIENLLCNDELTTKNILLKQKLNSKYDFWCIFENQDGYISTCGFKDEAEFLKHMKTVKAESIVEVKYGNK